jgi:signal transduction histidine kinase
LSLLFKFIVVLAGFCLGVAVNIYAAIWASNTLLSEAKTTFETSFEAASLVQYIRTEVSEQHDEILRRHEEGLSEDEARQVTHAIDRYGAVMVTDLDRLAIVGEADELVPDLTVLSRQVLNHQHLAGLFVIGAGAQTDDVNQRFQQYIEQHRRVDQNLQDLASHLDQARQQAAGQTLSATEKVIGILVGMAAIELIFLVIILSLFKNWIIQPIMKVRQATAQITTGNLAYRLEGLGKDEFGALAVEVNHMAQSLGVAQDELKKTERLAAVGEMVSVVAHNIRNPLAGIRATAQASLHTLAADSDLVSPQRQIIASVDSLEQWLKELLHLNRPIELTREPMSVDELITDLHQIFQPSLDRKNLKMDYQPSAAGQVIHVDRQYFTQAMASILDNAIDASPAGEAVKLGAGPSDGQFAIEIADAGPGISDALYQQVFESYFSTKPGGTGIGLFMAKKIIEAHNGALNVVRPEEPDASRGATFRIELQPGPAAEGQ